MMVRRIPRFLAMPASERWLLLRCVAIVAVIRVALWIAPFRVLLRVVDRGSRPVRGARSADEAAHIAEGVEIAGRLIPDATCLTQALAALLLMRRRGLDAELRLGVRRDGAGSVEAHAWIESAGRVLVGAREARAFSPLTSGRHDGG
jgi:hypothetical protein